MKHSMFEQVVIVQDDDVYQVIAYDIIIAEFTEPSKVLQ